MPNVERLKQLRRVLIEVPEDRLHMTYWSHRAECGTAHCLGGWAAVDPWFQQNTPIHEVFAVFPNGTVAPASEYGTFGQLAELFDLGEEQANKLFGSNLSIADDPHCVGKNEVLDNIDRLIAGEDAEPYAATHEDYDDE
jgi:hypothetical protein